jgi:hypothetical protein
MLAAVADGQQAGKGRPTPKRSEVRQRRRAPAPATRKEAAALRRGKVREERGKQRQALLTGDERHLPQRDAGPAKRLARDVVDSRFTLGQIFFGLIIVVLASSLVVNGKTHPRLASSISLLSVVALIALAGDAVRVGKRAKRAVAARFGDKDTVGITAYAALRSMQPRRLRRPPAKVRRGEPVG